MEWTTLDDGADIVGCDEATTEVLMLESIEAVDDEHGGNVGIARSADESRRAVDDDEDVDEETDRN